MSAQSDQSELTAFEKRLLRAALEGDEQIREAMSEHHADGAPPLADVMDATERIWRKLDLG
jgi:hypothetical protein